MQLPVVVLFWRLAPISANSRERKLSAWELGKCARMIAPPIEIFPLIVLLLTEKSFYRLSFSFEVKGKLHATITEFPHPLPLDQRQPSQMVILPPFADDLLTLAKIVVEETRLPNVLAAIVVQYLGRWGFVVGETY